MKNIAFGLVNFLSAATLVAADYGFTCPPRFMSVCCCVLLCVVVCCCVLLCVGTDENCNFSAVHSLIELKLGGDLWLVSQICEHVWFQDLIIFYIVNKQKNKKITKIAKIAVLQNLRFSRRSKSD
jgi:hypothetical protein